MASAKQEVAAVSAHITEMQRRREAEHEALWRAAIAAGIGVAAAKLLFARRGA